MRLRKMATTYPLNTQTYAKWSAWINPVGKMSSTYNLWICQHIELGQHEIYPVRETAMTYMLQTRKHTKLSQHDVNRERKIVSTYNLNAQIHKNSVNVGFNQWGECQTHTPVALYMCQNIKFSQLSTGKVAKHVCSNQQRGLTGWAFGLSEGEAALVRPAIMRSGMIAMEKRILVWVESFEWELVWKWRLKFWGVQDVLASFIHMQVCQCAFRTGDETSKLETRN